MEANELRIGNWVSYSDNAVKIAAGFFVNSSQMNIETDCEPIPLTPEILEKAGFEKNDRIQQNFSYILQLKSRMTLVYYKGDSSCLSIEQDNKMIDFASGRCKYLHQLQNLYFALTGEELEIKL